MSAKQLHEMNMAEAISEVWRRAKAERRKRSLRAPAGSEVRPWQAEILMAGNDSDVANGTLH